MNATRSTIALVLVILLTCALPVTAGQPVAVDGDPSTTERIAPDDPIEFAVAVSQLRFADGAAQSVTVSRDDTFADSLAGAPLTGDGPLLFTRTEQLPAATRTEINRVLPEDGVVFILGGTAAVSQAVEDELGGLGFDVVRLAGPSRVETAVQIASEVRSQFGDTGSVAVARGFGPEDNPTAAWADSVTAGAWVAGAQHPVLISPTASMPESVVNWLAADDPDETVLLGGEAALSAEVFAAAPNGRRVAGPERAATAAAVATDLLDFDSAGDRTVVVFNPFEPNGWTRGLSVAGLAAEIGAPLLALNLPGVPPATAELLSASGSDPEVEVLIAAPEAEVDRQLVAELDELDAGPMAPIRPTPGVPRLVSITEDGEPGDFDSTSPDLGGDGTVIAFTSSANNLGDTDPDRQRDPYIHQTTLGTTTEISGSPSPLRIGNTSAQAISGDNGFVVSIGRGIEQNNIRVWDVVAGETLTVTEMTDVDPESDRRPNTAVISEDGEWVGFSLGGDIYRQRTDGTDRERVLEGRDDGDIIFALWLSEDGSRLAFRTTRDDLSGGSFDAQVFVMDVGQQPVLVSQGIDGQAANQQVQDIAMSSDGSIIVYNTEAANMTGDDVGGRTPHLYAYDVAAATTRLVDRGPADEPSAGGVATAVNGFGLSLTNDGREVITQVRDSTITGEEESTRGAIVSIDLVTGAIRAEVRPPEGGSVRYPSVSGDGRRIAFEQADEFNGITQIYVVDRP